MITVDTCGMTNYSPLIPAIKAMCNANPGDKMEIVTDQVAAFQDLKEYLSLIPQHYSLTLFISA